MSGYVWPASYVRSGPAYFAIPPSFITSRARGTFNGSIIITMGYHGSQLNYMELDMAEAFIARGAKEYVGWSGAVLAEHTDLAITYLLKHIFLERQGIEEAVTQTMDEIRGDMTYESTLLALPDEHQTTESTQIIDDARIYKKKWRIDPSNRPTPN